MKLVLSAVVLYGLSTFFLHQYADATPCYDRFCGSSAKTNAVDNNADPSDRYTIASEQLQRLQIELINPAATLDQKTILKNQIEALKISVKEVDESRDFDQLSPSERKLLNIKFAAFDVADAKETIDQYNLKVKEKIANEKQILKDTKSNLDRFTRDIKSQEKLVSNEEKAVNKAKGAQNKAKTAYTSAKVKLDKAKKDGSSDKKIKDLKSKLDAARTKYDEANSELNSKRRSVEKLKSQLTQLARGKDKIIQSRTNAITQTTQAKNNLQDAKNDLKEKEKALKSAKKAKVGK